MIRPVLEWMETWVRRQGIDPQSLPMREWQEIYDQRSRGAVETLQLIRSKQQLWQRRSQISI